MELALAALRAWVPPVGQAREHDAPVAWREVGDEAADGLDDADSLVADDLAERIGQRQRVDQVDVRGAGRDCGGADEGGPISGTATSCQPARPFSWMT